MKVLLISQIPVVFEKYRRSGEEFPYFQAQAAWKKALEKLGHQVLVFRYTDSIILPNKIRIFFQGLLAHYLPLWYARSLRLRSAFYPFSLENRLRNRKLLNLALKWKPDLVLISAGTTVIFPKTIRLVKERIRAKVVLVSGTAPVTTATVTERKMVKDIDCFVTNDKYHAFDWLMLGAKKAICLPMSAVDPTLHKKVELTPKEEKEYSSDLCFVGSLTERRVKILSQLKGFNLKVWGDPHLGVDLTLLGNQYQGRARGEKMVKIFNAAGIVLNFHPLQMQHGGNMRTFEIPGCGAFQLADRVDPSWFKVEKEVVVFKDLKDLKKKIKYYLENEHERQAIAQAGYRRAHQDHTYEKRFKKLLAEIGF